MNRQQRRTRAKYAQSEYDFREKRREYRENAVMMYCILIGLAIYDVYGNSPTRITKICKAFSARARWLSSAGKHIEDLQRELYDKTGIEFQFIDD